VPCPDPGFGLSGSSVNSGTPVRDVEFPSVNVQSSKTKDQQTSKQGTGMLSPRGQRDAEAKIFSPSSYNAGLVLTKFVLVAQLLRVWRFTKSTIIIIIIIIVSHRNHVIYVTF